jgi:desulfoferrodoxin (superoxide reductase-like protein)
MIRLFLYIGIRRINCKQEKKHMPYITCTKKKSQHKVHISVCEQCKGMKCADYRDFVQPVMFPSFVLDKPLRKAGKVKRVKPAPLPDKPEQLSFI